MREPIARWLSKPFMKFYPSNPIDWWEGTVVGPKDQGRRSARQLSYLTLDEEGLYHRICNWMYLTGYDLPDDNLEAARELHVNHNQYAVVLDRLIQKRVLVRFQGTIINLRVIEERQEYLKKSQPKTSAKATAAREREAKAKVIKESPIGDALGDLRRGLSASEFAGVIQQIETVLSEYKQRETDPPSQGARPPQSEPVTPPVCASDPPSLPFETPLVSEARPPQSRAAAMNKIKELADKAEHKTVPTRARHLDIDIEKNPPTPPRGGKKDGGTRLPDDWSLPADWRDEMMEKFVIRLDELFKEANGFRDFWIGVPGREGKKVDWRATFRNRIRSKYTERGAQEVAKATQLWWQKPEKLAGVTADQWVGLIHKWANGTWPFEKLGPAPGSRYCVVPDSVIERLDLVRFYTSSGSLKPGVIPPWSGGSH